KSLTDPFAPSIYIECTIEHVDNNKYGKDVTKFILIKEKDPGAKCLCISSTGFSLPVIERARESRIDTLTYEELFARFQQFSPYVKAVLDSGDAADELKSLAARYEEPFFEDPIGKDPATDYLTTWRDSTDRANRWLIVVGEYGTGKTALTKMLLRRWAGDYRSNALKPIPIRLELRNFSRQFDARSLLHHFLDTNQLGHIS